MIKEKYPEWGRMHSGTNFCIIAVGNKCDLRDDPAYVKYGNRAGVDMKKAYEWFEKVKIPYIETSAKNGKNVNFLFRHAVYEYWIQSHSGCMPYSK